MITNYDSTKLLANSDACSGTCTCIRQIYIAAEGEVTSYRAMVGAKRAIENGGLDATDIDLIVVGTTTPDVTSPAAAAILQQKLGITHGSAFDVQAVCSGFVFGVA